MKLFVFAATLVSLASAFTAPSFTARTTRTPSFLKAIEDGDVNGVGANGTAEKKKVLVLGGDGFCGWPTSLYLSDQGHDVVIVDNLSRRNIDTELGCDSLTPIQSPEVRWNV